ncbi:MAG TPA: CHC2 zinc finger domain-containing protein [Pseudonocardiaceae bacterium]|nr:CHC2 zinc finger domain-containing protein [Pseudonocardiaceae bacterium]
MNDRRQPRAGVSARVDVEAVRAANSLAEVIATSGVELTARGHGYVGRCPFHDDHTPSLSVDGTRGRFHCFGCGAHGDVIDYVTRLTGLGFRDAVQMLQAGTVTSGLPGTVPAMPAPPPVRQPQFTVPVERAHQINELAWEHFTRPPARPHAQAYLGRHRGIDVTALGEATGGAPLVGYAGASWQSLAQHLTAAGVTGDELVELDLCHRARRGGLIDAYRGRLILPVRNEQGRLVGFLGRDTTGHPGVPKYRNPTRTAVYDKSQALYRPAVHPPHADATVVVVEGPLDALAIAATAATAGQAARYAPCTTSGVTVSTAQADAIVTIHPSMPVIAMDGDDAGGDGTTRWLQALCLTRRRPALVTTLPAGTDPASWLAEHGPDGLAAFDRHPHPSMGEAVVPHLPGRELVRLAVQRCADPTAAVLSSITPLTATLPSDAVERLLGQVEAEMSRQGWNPHHSFESVLRHHATTALRQHPARSTWPASPAAPRRPSTEPAPRLATREGPSAPSLT